jgi:hypothetical protein
MQQFPKNKQILYFSTALLSLILLFSFRDINNQSVSVQCDSGDTTAFTVNSSNGWGLYSSYLENINDSVEFELILFRNTPDNNNWNNDSEVGTIVSGYAPSIERIINYQQLPRNWQITIKPNGKCFFRLLGGPEPENSSFVLPVQTKYKK